jgi:hypothetical protein
VTSAAKLLLTVVINSGYHQQRAPNRCDLYRDPFRAGPSVELLPMSAFDAANVQGTPWTLGHASCESRSVESRSALRPARCRAVSAAVVARRR